MRKMFCCILYGMEIFTAKRSSFVLNQGVWWIIWKKKSWQKYICNLKVDAAKVLVLVS